MYLEERPGSVKDRKHFGHWERDTMHGAEKKPDGTGFKTLKNYKNQVKTPLLHPADNRSRPLITGVSRKNPVKEMCGN